MQKSKKKIAQYVKEFRKDVKRVKRNPRHAQDINKILLHVKDLLVESVPLPNFYRDHALTGNWKGCRECHLKPDLLLIYDNTEPEILRLVRLGSHSEIFSK